MSTMILGLNVLLIIITTLPLLPLGWWWIRVLEYPRFQIAVGLALALGSLARISQKIRCIGV